MVQQLYREILEYKGKFSRGGDLKGGLRPPLHCCAYYTYMYGFDMKFCIH